MAIRGSVARRSVKDPLTATLQDFDRRLRNVERTSNQAGTAGADGADGATGAAGAAGTVVQAAVLVTAADGRVTWIPGGAFTAASVVSASVVGATARAVTIESVSATTVVARVWALPAATAVGAGVSVHLTAVPPG